jgi:energy-coupling factor transport system ATP-binding protein
MQPIVELKSLTHIYSPGSVFEKTALEDINLKIMPGEMIGLIGHTGSGKSTLIQHMNALLKPSSGSVLINGADINADKKNLKSIREKVGLVFQYPEHQLFEVNIYKDVAFGPERMGLSQDVVDKRVRAALSLVGIGEELYEKSPFDLSGGQKRRVAIAGVLSMLPDVLILDDPTAGLDPGGREEILSQIKDMHERLGNTVILVSHSMEDAARLTNRVIVMNQGRIACDDTATNVFAQAELLNSIGLSVPQVSLLMTRLNELNPKIPVGAFTVEDAAETLLTSIG